VYSTDVRLRVAPNGLYTYPNVMVICGDPQLADDRRDTVLNPVLIVEVLSESTEAYDRNLGKQRSVLLVSFQRRLTLRIAFERYHRYAPSRTAPSNPFSIPYFAMRGKARLRKAVCRSANFPALAL